jgi:serine/threonine protein kinase
LQNDPSGIVYACKVIDKAKLIEKILKKDAENKEMRIMHALTSISNEIKIGRSLDHPNVIKCFDHSETQNNFYIFMEYCAKGTLEKLITDNGGNFSEQVSLFIFQQMVEGCMYLFHNSIFHRDLKPANVLISADNHVKIADFGFCKKLEEHKDDKMHHTCVGTPYYMSPQILDGRSYSIKCDVWSLGVIFYEMLTGKKPWAVANNAPHNVLLKAIIDNPLAFPVNLPISEWIKQLLGQMLQIYEEKRISMEQVQSIVQQMTKGAGSTVNIVPQQD